MNNPLDAARAQILAAKRIAILTGAGVSAESGVPTFRGPNGLWRNHRPETLATPEAFARNPALVWAWYRWRRALVARCRPNAGHLALARLALTHPHTHLITQNVDGLHDAAAEETAARLGLEPEPARALELHGNLFRNRCTACGHRSLERSQQPPATTAQRSNDDEPPPRCPRCNALVRPDVVWFGEALDPETIERAFDCAREAELCLVIGTSALVQPAASLALETLHAGGRVIEVNPEPTPLTAHAHVSIRGHAAQTLPQLLR